MANQDTIVIQGLRQNNLKNVSLQIPKGKIVVFTGVSGSGKSSIVFDTIAAESQRQMNETYTAFIRGRLPKYEKPKVDKIDNLSASVIVDQSRLGGNARSTVGTISDMYSALRLLYSRIGTPYVGTASYFSFNDPNGMCPECSGIGKVNAGACTVVLIDRFAVDCVINTGIAGSLDAHINIGDIVLSEDAVQYDMDATNFGYQLGEIPRVGTMAFHADDRLIAAAEEENRRVNPEIRTFIGRVCSGDKFVSDSDTKNWIIKHF